MRYVVLKVEDTNGTRIYRLYRNIAVRLKELSKNRFAIRFSGYALADIMNNFTEKADRLSVFGQLLDGEFCKDHYEYPALTGIPGTHVPVLLFLYT